MSDTFHTPLKTRRPKAGTYEDPWLDPGMHHPAYAALYRAYSINGLSVDGALTAVSRWWEGKALPSLATLEAIATRDRWRERVHQQMQETGRSWHVKIWFQLRDQWEMVQELKERVARMEIPKDNLPSIMKLIAGVEYANAHVNTPTSYEIDQYFRDIGALPPNPDADVSLEAQIEAHASMLARERQLASGGTSADGV